MKSLIVFLFIFFVILFSISPVWADVVPDNCPWYKKNSTCAAEYRRQRNARIRAYNRRVRREARERQRLREQVRQEILQAQEETRQGQKYARREQEETRQGQKYVRQEQEEIRQEQQRRIEQQQRRHKKDKDEAQIRLHLSEAVDNGDLSKVHSLLAAGADPNSEITHPISFAAEISASDEIVHPRKIYNTELRPKLVHTVKSADVAQALVYAGADVNVYAAGELYENGQRMRDETEVEGEKNYLLFYTPAHFARTVEIAKVFDNAGANPLAKTAMIDTRYPIYEMEGLLSGQKFLTEKYVKTPREIAGNEALSQFWKEAEKRREDEKRQELAEQRQLELKESLSEEAVRIGLAKRLGYIVNPIFSKVVDGRLGDDVISKVDRAGNQEITTTCKYKSDPTVSRKRGRFWCKAEISCTFIAGEGAEKIALIGTYKARCLAANVHLHRPHSFYTLTDRSKCPDALSCALYAVNPRRESSRFISIPEPTTSRGTGSKGVR